MDFVVPEPHLVDFKASAKQRGRGYVLDGEANGLRGSVETLVLKLALPVLASARKQLRWRAVIQPSNLHLLSHLLANAVDRLSFI